MIYKKKLYLRKNIGRLLFFRRHSNIFLVLLNSKKKHLITLTSGNSGLGKKKKDKLAIHNMSKLVNKLLLYFVKYNIKQIYLYVRNRLARHFFNLRKLLKKNNIWILGFIYILKKPHGFCRGRKLRRV